MNNHSPSGEHSANSTHSEEVRDTSIVKRTFQTSKTSAFASPLKRKVIEKAKDGSQPGKCVKTLKTGVQSLQTPQMQRLISAVPEENEAPYPIVSLSIDGIPPAILFQRQQEIIQQQREMLVHMQQQQLLQQQQRHLIQQQQQQQLQSPAVMQDAHVAQETVKHLMPLVVAQASQSHGISFTNPENAMQMELAMQFGAELHTTNFLHQTEHANEVLNPYQHFF